jgi:hypothetical protein
MPSLTGLTLPFLSEADPEQAGEGSLDPLRLAPLSEALAEEILPGVTNRMSRVRFLTAIAVSSSLSVGLEDVPPKDGITTPYLAFEWHLIEAIARRSRYGLPDTAVRNVPGINKAGAVVSRGGHLSASTYLKTPKVFGFVGVYKRLAIELGLVDSDLALQEEGELLVRMWEQEQGLGGFADLKPGAGGKFAKRLKRAVTQGLIQGSVNQPAGSWLWSQLVDVLRPDGAGRAERRRLRTLLLEPSRPIRRELVEALQRISAGADADVLRMLRPTASRELRKRLLAIEAYERVAELLTAAFDIARRMSTTNGLRPLTADEIAKHPIVRRAAGAVTGALATAFARLERLGRYGPDLEANLGRFEPSLPAAEFVAELLDHHERIQADKSARPWFEEDSGGFFVRSPYTFHLEPEITGAYVNPYRVGAVQSFLVDLK